MHVILARLLPGSRVVYSRMATPAVPVRRCVPRPLPGNGMFCLGGRQTAGWQVAAQEWDREWRTEEETACKREHTSIVSHELVGSIGEAGPCATLAAGAKAQH